MRPPLHLPHSTRNRGGWQEALLIGLLLLGLTAVFFWPQLAGGRVLYWGDIGLYFLPMTTFLRANLLAGHLPLWNPLILCGTPFVGNPQTWPAYPISWLLPLVSAGYFLNLTVAFHVWWASLGTFLFLRRAEGLRARASLVGALVFGFGGQLVSKEQFPNMVQAIAWLPWVLGAVYGLVSSLCVSANSGEPEGKRPPRPNSGEPEEERLSAISSYAARMGGGALSWGAAVWLGVLIGLQVLAAHVQMTLLTLYVGVAYGVFLWVGARGNRPGWGTLAGRLAAAGAIAGGLCAVQVLPTVELYQSAWRQKLPFAAVDRFTLPLNQVGNFALPVLHGSPFWGDFAGRGNFWETCCYVSILGFGLAAAGVWAAWRGLKRAGAGSFRFWSVAAGVGAWMALGGKGGLYHAAYAVLPGFRSFHDPARCLLWSAWGLSLLAGFGFEWAEGFVPRPQGRWAVLALCAGLIFGDLTHFGRTLYPLASPAALAAGPESFDAADRVVFDAHQGRVLAPDTHGTWERFTTYRTFRRTDANYLPLWLETQTPNLTMLSSVPAAFGYEPEARRDAQMVTGKVNDALRPGAALADRRDGMRWAGILGVRTVAFLRSRPVPETIPHALLLASFASLPIKDDAPDSATLQICRNELWQSRARLVTDFVSVPTRMASQALVFRSSETRTVVVGQPGFAPHAPGKETLAPIVLDTPDRVVVDARAGSPALLVLADTLHPGWRAFDNGRPVPILSADGFLRAVPLPVPGAHRVVFEYKPTSFLLGCYVSLLTLCGLLGFGAFLLGTSGSFFSSRAGVSTSGRE